VPLVVLSPEAGATARILRLTSDAVDYIGKPASPSFVAKRVQKILGVEVSNSGGAPGSRGPGRILLIDGARAAVNPLGERLRSDGHDVVFARSLTEALGFLEVQGVDCVVLDPSTTGLSGLDMARRIRTGRGTASVPVLLLTESEDSSTRSTYASAGVDDSIIKSTDTIEMAARIGELAFARRRPPTASGSRLMTRGIEAPRPSEGFSELISLAAIGADVDALPAALPPPPAAHIPQPTASFHDRTSSSAFPQVRPGPTPPPAASTQSPARTTDVPPSGSEFSPLFEQVLSVSGLQQLVGRGGLRRALERAGVEPRTLNADGLEKAMPEIRRTLSIFLSKEEVERSVELISALTHRTTRSLANLRSVRGGG
jgi:DNA-binding response OmpR family regulator